MICYQISLLNFLDVSILRLLNPEIPLRDYNGNKAA